MQVDFIAHLNFIIYESIHSSQFKKVYVFMSTFVIGLHRFITVLSVLPALWLLRRRDWAVSHWGTPPAR